jgi:hypothetical protein
LLQVIKVYAKGVKEQFPDGGKMSQVSSLVDDKRLPVTR